MWILPNSKDLTIACVSDLSENYWGSDCFHACLLPPCCIPLATSLSLSVALELCHVAMYLAFWPHRLKEHQRRVVTIRARWVTMGLRWPKGYSFGCCFFDNRYQTIWTRSAVFCSMIPWDWNSLNVDLTSLMPCSSHELPKAIPVESRVLLAWSSDFDVKKTLEHICLYHFKRIDSSSDPCKPFLFYMFSHIFPCFSMVIWNSRFFSGHQH